MHLFALRYLFGIHVTGSCCCKAAVDQLQGKVKQMEEGEDAKRANLNNGSVRYKVKHLMMMS